MAAPAGGDDLRDLIVRLAERSEDVIYRYRLAPDRGYDYVSPGVASLTGYTPEEYYADPDLGARTLHPDDRPEVEERTLEAEGPMTFRVIRKDGAVIWAENTANVITDESGKPVALEGVARDITERRRAEQELRRREDTVSALFEKTGVPMLIVDDERRYVDANQAACELLGVTREELLSRRIDDFTTPEDLVAIDELWQTFLTAGSLAGEYKVLRADGTVREVEFTATAHVLPGRHLSAVFDLTVHRQLAHQLRQAQKMEAVGRLAGGVAHDFNNQLAAIRLYCDLALAHADDPERVRGEVEGIVRVADLASQLTAQLLAFGRMQLLQPRVLDLNVVVQRAEQMLRRLLGSEVVLVTELSPGLDPVQADPAQVEQVIVNLALNARDAMPGGGTLTIGTANAEREEGARVVLAVSDTGVGMDEVTRSRLFEPFFTTKGAGEGTGLGLATVYGIVSQSGGSIEVESEPGRGSTFRLYLPRSEAGAEARRRREESAPVGGSETLLLVEDEEAVRSVTTEVLENAGYRVLAAAHGAEALELAEGYEGEIDAVVTDVLMPGLGGPEIVDRLRERSPGLAAVYMSGYAEAGAISPERLAGATAFVQKPFSTAELGRAIRAVLDMDR